LIASAVFDGGRAREVGYIFVRWGIARRIAVVLGAALECARQRPLADRESRSLSNLSHATALA
jgi:hypothetical protein